MKPQVSILIPTRNRRSRLLRTLESLRQQNAGANVFEVLVVSDGSTDSTKAAVERLASGAEWSGRRLICVEQDWKGAAAARNTALQMAVGDIVLFLDDDVVADPNLVTAHLDSHKSARIAEGGRGLVVLGDILPDERPEAMHRQMRLWWLDHYRRLAAGEPTFAAFFTGNVSIEREAALTAGGFDESLDYGEDVEFGYRLSLQGLQFKYEPRARASTMNVKSGAALLRDLHRSGQGNARIYHKFPTTLRDLPLSAYGETNLRMLLSRGLLLNLSRNRFIERIIDKAFAIWAESKMPTRLDRQMFEMARSYYFWTGVRAEIESREEWARLTSAGVPVLTYHSVEPSDSRKTNPYIVSKKRFSRQMFLLRLLGYRVMPLETLVNTWEQGELPPPRTMAITFDDGYSDNMLHAWPVLSGFGYAATLFFVTGLAGKASTWDEAVEGGPRPLLTYDELRKLDGQGFRVEAHTVTHPDLRALSQEAATAEIKESRRQLEANLGRTVNLFAYPYGHYNDCLQKEVESAGYKAAFSVRSGLNTLRTARFALKRTSITGEDNMLTFALKVWTGDNPLRYIPDIRRTVNRKYMGEHKLLPGKAL